MKITTHTVTISEGHANVRYVSPKGEAFTLDLEWTIDENPELIVHDELDLLTIPEGAFVKIYLPIGRYAELEREAILYPVKKGRTFREILSVIYQIYQESLGKKLLKLFRRTRHPRHLQTIARKSRIIDAMGNLRYFEGFP